jgi:hypothetical protein
MSFDLNEVHRLKAAGGKVLAKYNKLVTAADQAAHGSPAEQELGAFQLAWLQDPARVTREAEAAS